MVCIAIHDREELKRYANTLYDNKTELHRDRNRADGRAVGMLRAEALGLRIPSVADARFASRLPLCFLQGLVTSLRLERKLRNNELC